MTLLTADKKLYLLVHTITITEAERVVEAQFFHAAVEGRADVRLIGRRTRCRPRTAKLGTLMKRKRPRIRHHLRTIRLGIHNQEVAIIKQVAGSGDGAQLKTHTPSPPPQLNAIKKIDDPDEPLIEQLSSDCTPEQTNTWLVKNRFEKYAETFSNFSGADMLRMSREDLIQICGQADGIRLYNAVHLKTIAPKLKIYVCRQNTSVFNAVFLLTHSNTELLEKLSALMGLTKDQVQDIYMEGPHSIHVQLNNDVIRHIKEETMFSVEILQENGNYIFLLKRTVK